MLTLAEHWWVPTVGMTLRRVKETGQRLVATMVPEERAARTRR